MKTAPDFSTTTKSARKLICILAFAIPVLAVLIGLITGSFAPFGEKDVMTAGGAEKHLTRFYEFYDYIHGEPNPVNGEDMTTVFTYYLSDPLNLIALLFPRAAITAVLNLLYALKLGLAGLFMSLFLTRHKERVLLRKVEQESVRAEELAVIAEKQRKKEAARKLKTKGQKELRLGGSEEPKSKIGRFLQILDLPNLGFSLAFALSAWMFGQGMDVSRLSVVVLFPVIMLALDSLIEDGKWRLYAALMTASVFCNFYMTIIVFIFTILYFAVYSHKSTAQALRSLVLKLIADALAAGAGMVIILNTVTSSFFRDEISLSFPRGAVSTSFFDIIKSMMPQTAPSNTLYFGYGLDIYCGLFTILLVVLYILNPNISLRRKLSQTGLLLTLGSGLILVTPNYIFNGFFASRENMCVFGFLFVFQLISIAYEAFLNLEHTSILQANIGAILFFTLVIASVFLCDGYDQMKPFYVGLELFLAYYVFICLYRSNNMTRWLFIFMMPLLLIGEVVITYVNGLRTTGIESYAYTETKESRIYETSKRIRTKDPTAKILVYGQSDSEPVTNALLGYDYVLTTEGTSPIDSLLEKIGTENGFDIYQNPYSVHGYYMPKEAASFTYNPQYPFTSLSGYIYELTGVDGVYSKAEGKLSVSVSVVFNIKMKEDIRKGNYEYAFKTGTAGDLYGHTDETVHFGENPGSGTAVFYREKLLRERPIPNPLYEYAVFDSNKFKEFYNSLTKANVTPVSSNAYAVDITAPADGFVVLSLPARYGWGSEISSISGINLSEKLLVLSVSAGENHLSLSYSPVFLYTGLIISILSFTVIILISIKGILIIPKNAFQRSSGFIRDNYVYFVTAGITLLSLLLMMCFTSSIPFGNDSPLIGDGYYQAYNGYRGMVHDVQNGNYSFVNWNVGIAIDRYSEYAGYYLSPWSLLKLKLLPDALIFPDLIFSRVLSFIIPGLCIILYLTHRRRGAVMKKTDWRLIPVGVAFSLSSYAIAFFVYGGFGFLQITPLILLGMERLIYDKKPLLYILLLFSFMGDAYYAFMLCEFIFLYFFTMEFSSIKDMFFKGIRILVASVAAAGLACYRLIPYFFRTQVSPYKVNDSISPGVKANGSYLSVFSETMSFRQPSTVTDNNYEANLYIGILVLLCIPLYLINKKIPISIRIRRMLLVVLLFLGFGNSTLNYIFHGFHYQSFVPNRFAAFYITLLLIMLYDCLVYWHDYSKKAFALGIGSSAAICITLWTIAHNMDNDLKNSVLTAAEATLSYKISLLITIIYVSLAVLQLWKKRVIIRNCMVSILLAEVVLSSFCTFQKSLGGDTIGISQDPYMINELSARNTDMHTDFIASEYIGDQSNNTAESANYSSISAFSSTLSNSHIQLLEKWSIGTSTNQLTYNQGNALADMMLHIKYHIINNTMIASVSPYPEIDREATLHLHENPWYLPVGLFIPVTNELDEWDKKTPSDYKYNVLAYQNAFAHALSCGDIYTEIPMKFVNSESSLVAEPNTIFIERSEDPSEPSSIYIHLSEDIEGDIYSFCYETAFYIGTKEKGKALSIATAQYLNEDNDATSTRIAILNKKEMDKLHSSLNQCTMSDAKISGASFSGTINAPRDGIVYLSIPYMDEWIFSVDGKQIQSESLLGGAGIRVTPGQHTITAFFEPSGMWLGITLSLTTLLLVIIWVIIVRKAHH